MDMDEKAVVKIDASGDVVACAKGLAAGECGYEKGAKVCGKCGAMAVQQKMSMEMPEDDEENYVEDEELLSEEEKGMLRMLRRRMQKMGDNGEMIEDEEMLDEEEKGMYGMLRRRMRRKQMGVAAPEEMMPNGDMPAAMADRPDEAEMEDDKENKNICPKCSYKNAKNAKFCSQCGTKMMGSDDEMDDEEKMGMGGPSEMEQMATDEMEKRRRARANRMQSMGFKSEDWDEGAYICGFQQKMLTGKSSPCVACPGGCAPEQGLPTLIEVQGLAEDMFNGKILASGYSDIKDVFVVQVKRDNAVIEAIFDGQDARCKGWKELDPEQIDAKSANGKTGIISFEEAGQIAVKSIEGEIVSIDADEFEGSESYAVEISGADGLSYDVYVSLDGQVLGYDTYDATEALEIDAEIAEIALKRAYGVDEREAMAKEGMAMPDGSFPIKDEADLRNAIQAHGRAKDIEAAKAHITKRAKELGLEDMIPEEWSDGSKSLTVESDPGLLAELLEFELMALDDNSTSEN